MTDRVSRQGKAGPYANFDDRIAAEAIPFSLDPPASFDSAVDRLAAALGSEVDLVGLGEALHGGEEILLLRNRLFRRLVERHGFTAIAIESSLPRGRLVNDYVEGRGAASYDEVAETGFSHGFGRLAANRELVEWVRSYNADPAHPVKVRFCGFDSPTEMTGTESPRQLLGLALDYLAAIDGTPDDGGRRERIDALLGQDADWEDPAAMMDPARSIGLSPNAAVLRVETEDLVADLQRRRPELVAEGGLDRYREARHHAAAARQLLAYHALMARPLEMRERLVRGLGMRDAMMADNLAFIVSREHERGRVFAFAHNSHLQRGAAHWQLGPHDLSWCPAGAHLAACFGDRYAVIGTGVGLSDENGIGRPEPGTIEARLTALPGPVRFVPTHRGEDLSTVETADLPVRSGSRKNSSYFPLTTRSLADFDWLAVLDSTGYSRGGPALPDPDAVHGQ